MYQANNSRLPDNIQNIFNNNFNVHHQFTRSQNKENFEVKTCRTKTRSFVIILFLVLNCGMIYLLFFPRPLIAFKRSLKYKYVEDYKSI